MWLVLLKQHQSLGHYDVPNVYSPLILNLKIEPPRIFLSEIYLELRAGTSILTEALKLDGTTCVGISRSFNAVSNIIFIDSQAALSVIKSIGAIGRFLAKTLRVKIKLSCKVS